MPTRRRRLGPAMLDWYPEESTPGDIRAARIREDRGLLSHGVSIKDLYRRTATDVDEILKGAKPPICLWYNRRSLSL